jgi:hypothetical protein
MTKSLRKLMTASRGLESRLTKAFEHAAQTVAGSNVVSPPLESVELAVDDIAAHVQPAGRGRFSFPFNRVTITFAAPTPEDQARFDAICEGPPAIQERVLRRLVAAGCDSPDVDVHVEYTPALPVQDSETGDASPASRPRTFSVAMARVDTDERARRGPAFSVDVLVLSGEADRAAYSFTAFPVAIGRGADVRDSRNQLLRINHVAFTESEHEVNRTVSRRHARIELDEATGRPRIIDDNSAQGTSVIRGGRGIAVPRGSRGLGLKSDDEIVLGQARIKVQVVQAKG